MQNKTISMDAAHDFYAKMPLARAIPLGLQHVFAMFVGNLTPLLIIMGACGIAGGEFADLQVSVLQNAMFVAGVVTLVQLFAIGPIGGKVPIIMGTSSGFIGVFNSVAATMGGGVIAYGAIMGASILGGLFETVLGFFLKPLRRFFPAVVTGTVVLSIGLSLISVGINSFGGGNSAKDFGSMENLLLALFVLVVILVVKHGCSGFLGSSAIFVGIIAGYIAAIIMGFVLPTTAVDADGVEFTAQYQGEKADVKLPIPGHFSVENALTALGIVLQLGMPLADAAKSMATATGVKGRVEVVPTDTDYTVLIDYAHSPDGVENVLKAVRGFAKGRVVALFGCGGDRDRTKRPKMGKIAADLADFCVVTSDNPRTEEPKAIIDDILEGMKDSDTPMQVIVDRPEAIHWALAHAQKDDIIVLMGKGHETYQEVNHVKHHMDEREIVADYFA